MKNPHPNIKNNHADDAGHRMKRGAGLVNRVDPALGY
jgi:hypothetical protein